MSLTDVSEKDKLFGLTNTSFGHHNIASLLAFNHYNGSAYLTGF
jgi:hypothetical protein